jgi:hypothetical protein
MTISGWRSCLSDSALGREARVLQPPKMRKTFGVPEGQKRLEREKMTGSLSNLNFLKYLKQPAKGHVPARKLAQLAF